MSHAQLLPLVQRRQRFCCVSMGVETAILTYIMLLLAGASGAPSGAVRH